MTFVLYLLTAAALLALAHRFVRPLTVVAVLVLTLLPMLFTGRALLTNAVYGPVDMAYGSEPLASYRAPLGMEEFRNGVLSDIHAQMIPWRAALKDALGRSEWPLWNRSILSGDVLGASAQPAAFSPFTLIALIAPPAQSFTYTGAIFLFIAGLSMFLFVRDLGCRELVAIIAAAGWMYTGAISIFILWPLAQSWALLPLLFLGVRRVIERPGLRAMALLTFAFAILLLSGHPETALHAVALSGLYSLFELGRVTPRLARAMAGLVIPGVLALLIAAIQILPLIEASEQTLEYHFRVNRDPNRVPGEANATVLARLALDFFPGLLQRPWVIPVNSTFDSGAVGSILLAAAIYALFRLRTSTAWFFGGMTLFCLVAHAEWSPLIRLIHLVPLFDMTLLGRFSFAAAACFVILAALGLEELARREHDRALIVIGFAVLVVVTFGTLAISKVFLDPRGDPWTLYRPFADIAFLALAVLLLVARRPMQQTLTILLALLLAQQAVSHARAIPTIDAELAYPRIPIIDRMKEAPGTFRMAAIDRMFTPGASAMYGLEDVRGYQAMTFGRYMHTHPLWCEQIPVFHNKITSLKPFLSFLNVKYVMAPPDFEVPNGWREVARERGSKLLENEQVIERAFVPRHVRFGREFGLQMMEMAIEEDFREHAWIDADLPMHQRENGPGVTRIRDAKLGYKIDVSMFKPGWMVVSVPAWKGWRVYVDGRRVQHQIANLAFLSVYLPKGDHQVRVQFLPQTFVVGRAITLGTLLLLAIGALAVRQRSVKARRAASPAP